MQFFADILASPDVVWGVAIFMSVVCAYILQYYIDEALFSAFSALAMLATALIANTAFDHAGIVFSNNANGNVVAAAGIAICGLALVSILVRRIWNLLAETRQRTRLQATLEHEAHSGTRF